MRAWAGDDRESASVTAARQLAEEAQLGWRVQRPSARERRAAPGRRRTEGRTGARVDGPGQDDGGT